MNNVIFKRDLVRQVNLTFDLNYPITGPNEARAVDMFLVSEVHWVMDRSRKN